MISFSKFKILYFDGTRKVHYVVIFCVNSGGHKRIVEILLSPSSPVGN